MNFEEKLREELEKKNLSQSSIKNYIRNVEILNDEKELKNLNFLSKKEEVENKLSKKKLNTQRSYYISIVALLQTQPNKKKLYDYYHEKMMTLNKDIREEANKHNKTETQQKNWLEWDDIETKLNELKDEILTFKKEINKKQYSKLLKFIVLSLYTLQPPRRNLDYQLMDIVKNKYPKTEEKNYLVHDDNEFVFRRYKTAKSELKKKEEELKISISPELMKNINIYLKYHPLLKGKKITNTPIPFLVNYEGETLKHVNSITYILNGIFKKNLASSMLRHIYLSSKYSNQIDEMADDSKKMSHSTSTQKEYIKK